MFRTPRCPRCKQFGTHRASTFLVPFFVPLQEQRERVGGDQSGLGQPRSIFVCVAPPRFALLRFVASCTNVRFPSAHNRFSPQPSGSLLDVIEGAGRALFDANDDLINGLIGVELMKASGIQVS